MWKVLAIVGCVATLGLGGLLYYLCRELLDGWADAWGHSRPKRWRRG